MTASLQALRARWVFPVAAPPIPGGVVVLRGSQIESVGPYTGQPARDLGDVAIVPGLVNAHTHLEFSGLPTPLGTPGMPLPAWIRHAVASRRATDSAAHATAVKQGLRESLAAGTTTLGEIATTDWRTPAVGPDELQLSVRMFLESIAPVVDRVPPAIEAAEQFAKAAGPARILPGLSPHAPYTAHPRLLAALVTLGRQHQLPLAMHLAESPEEIELLQTGGGPLADLLRDFNAWDSHSEARFPRVLNYLEHLAAAPRALAIHGNYLDEDELKFLAEHAATMAVVYCPRTHHFFRHKHYPLAHMLRSGVSLALGTDSRASNPDLSLFAEMRFVAEHHADVDPETVLRLGTLGGARALGLADRVGTLEPGKQADLAVVRLDGTSRLDPQEALFGPGSGVVATWSSGREQEAG